MERVIITRSLYDTGGAVWVNGGQGFFKNCTFGWYDALFCTALFCER